MVIIKTSLCDYSYAYILVKRTITVLKEGANAGAIAADRNNIKVISKKCAPLTDCICKKKWKF